MPHGGACAQDDRQARVRPTSDGRARQNNESKQFACSGVLSKEPFMQKQTILAALATLACTAALAQAPANVTPRPPAEVNPTASGRAAPPPHDPLIGPCGANGFEPTPLHVMAGALVCLGSAWHGEAISQCGFLCGEQGDRSPPTAVDLGGGESANSSTACGAPATCAPPYRGTPWATDSHRSPRAPATPVPPDWATTNAFPKTACASMLWATWTNSTPTSACCFASAFPPMCASCLSRCSTSCST